jgi:hypothetical protein
MIDYPLRWQFELLSRSRTYRKRLLLLDQLDVSWPELAINLRALVGAILLIEMHQRPAVIRAAEWVISALVPQSVRRPITRGPLQIADGPWDLGAAIRVAYETLTPAVADALSEDAGIYLAATVWNGKAVRQPCSMYGYGEVLREAYVIANNALTDLGGDPYLCAKTARASRTADPRRSTVGQSAALSTTTSCRQVPT